MKKFAPHAADWGQIERFHLDKEYAGLLAVFDHLRRKHNAALYGFATAAANRIDRYAP